MNARISFERPNAEELNALFTALGWGEHSNAQLERSMGAYTATICARAEDEGMLVGYASVFSDEVLTTMFGEFAVHPKYQRRGIGRAMMLAVERAFPDAPIYVKALGDSREFYAAMGFRLAGTPMSSMYKPPSSLAKGQEQA